MVRNLRPVIFNWPGFVENCRRIEQLLKPLYPNTLVINSDVANQCPDWINLDSEAYYTAQLKEALRHVDTELSFFVQADCFHPDLPNIIKRSQELMTQYPMGIYAPNVDVTAYSFSKQRLKRFKSNCYHVPNPDVTCWCIETVLLKKIEPYLDPNSNKLGWGIGMAVCAIARENNRLIIRDYDWTVSHNSKRNYSSQDAGVQLEHFLNELPLELQTRISQLREEIKKLLRPPLLQRLLKRLCQSPIKLER